MRTLRAKFQRPHHLTATGIMHHDLPSSRRPLYFAGRGQQGSIRVEGQRHGWAVVVKARCKCHPLTPVGQRPSPHPTIDTHGCFLAVSGDGQAVGGTALGTAGITPLFPSARDRIPHPDRRLIENAHQECAAVRAEGHVTYPERVVGEHHGPMESWPGLWLTLQSAVMAGTTPGAHPAEFLRRTRRAYSGTPPTSVAPCPSPSGIGRRDRPATAADAHGPCGSYRYPAERDPHPNLGRRRYGSACGRADRTTRRWRPQQRGHSTAAGPPPHPAIEPRRHRGHRAAKRVCWASLLFPAMAASARVCFRIAGTGSIKT